VTPEPAGIGADGREGNNRDGKCKSIFLHDFTPWLQKFLPPSSKYLRGEEYTPSRDIQSSIAIPFEHNPFSDF
jgi:hypothetical protein